MCAAEPSGYRGRSVFGPQTRKFLRELGRNNDKAWFDAHRAEYEAHYLKPAKAFVEQVGPKIERFAPSIVWEPRINGSIFRINRDIRFSKDKTPYKDHIDMWFWEGSRKTALSGFFIRIGASSIILGAGSHGFSKDDLARHRTRLNDRTAAKQLSSLARRFRRAGYEVGGRHYKKPPKGFDGNPDAAELALHNALWASVERRHPAEMSTGKFPAYCAREWKKLAPLHQWLVARVRC